jgi:hypothetical protein
LNYGANLAPHLIQIFQTNFQLRCQCYRRGLNRRNLRLSIDTSMDISVDISIDLSPKPQTLEPFLIPYRRPSLGAAAEAPHAKSKMHWPVISFARPSHSICKRSSRLRYMLQDLTCAMSPGACLSPSEKVPVGRSSSSSGSSSPFVCPGGSTPPSAAAVARGGDDPPRSSSTKESCV